MLIVWLLKEGELSELLCVCYLQACPASTCARFAIRISHRPRRCRSTWERTQATNPSSATSAIRPSQPRAISRYLHDSRYSSFFRSKRGPNQQLTFSLSPVNSLTTLVLTPVTPQSLLLTLIYRGYPRARWKRYRSWLAGDDSDWPFRNCRYTREHICGQTERHDEVDECRWTCRLCPSRPRTRNFCNDDRTSSIHIFTRHSLMVSSQKYVLQMQTSKIG